MQEYKNLYKLHKVYEYLVEKGVISNIDQLLCLIELNTDELKRVLEENGALNTQL